MRGSARRALVPAALLLAACAGRRAAPLPSPKSSAAPRPAADAPASPVETVPIKAAPLPPPAAPRGESSELWRVDGRAVTKSDLGDYVLRRQPDVASDALERLVEEAVIDAEARREGVVVAPDALRAGVDEFVEERRREALLQFGADTDFEALLRGRWGRDLPSFRADAQPIVRTSLLRARLARLDQFREDGVEVRVLVLPTEEAARDAAKALREGADLVLYAERLGVRAPASPPPLRRGAVPEKDLETRLFAAREGAVLDPAPFAAETTTWWQVFKVTRAWKASSAPWTEIAPRVERSLADAPPTSDELAQWRARAYARHEIAPAKGSALPDAGR